MDLPKLSVAYMKGHSIFRGSNIYISTVFNQSMIFPFGWKIWYDEGMKSKNICHWDYKDCYNSVDLK